MIASKLASLGLSRTASKAVLALLVAALSAAVTAYATDGQLNLVNAAPIVAAFLTGIATLIDPNSGHAEGVNLSPSASTTPDPTTPDPAAGG